MYFNLLTEIMKRKRWKLQVICLMQHSMVLW